MDEWNCFLTVRNSKKKGEEMFENEKCDNSGMKITQKVRRNGNDQRNWSYNCWSWLQMSWSITYLHFAWIGSIFGHEKYNVNLKLLSFIYACVSSWVSVENCSKLAHTFVCSCTIPCQRSRTELVMLWVSLLLLDYYSMMLQNNRLFSLIRNADFT